ncbi:MAG: lipase family protein [Acidimicrobiia bacterium]|nr:lipase family protein [Acidimicrobiia bacterium]
MRRGGTIVALACGTALLLASCAAGDTDASDEPDAATPTTSVPARAGQAEVRFVSPPNLLSSGEPGDILEREPKALDDGVDGTAERVTYVSTSPNGDRVPVTGVMIRPNGPAPEGGFPIVTLGHGTTGVGNQCAPSLADPFEFPGVAELVADGYVVVASDYEGLGTEEQHPYLVGEASARSMIDIARAARADDEYPTDEKVVALGASQGGHASLFIREIAPTYAPDLELLGVAAAAPVTDVARFLLRGTTDPSNFPLTAEAIATWEVVYEDVDLESLVPPGLVDRYRLANLACNEDVAEAAEGVDPARLFRSDPQDLPAWRDIAVRNTPVVTETGVPVLITHGVADELVPVEGSRGFVAQVCDAGPDVLYIEDPNWDHIGAYLEPFPEIRSWVADRFAGAEASSTCAS